MPLWKRFLLGILRGLLLLVAHLKYNLKLFVSLFGKSPITVLLWAARLCFLAGQGAQKQSDHHGSFRYALAQFC